MLLAKRILTPIYVLTRNYKVTVAGGATEIGQTLCLLLRAQANISKLIVHDAQEHTPGFIMDLSHIPTESSIKGYVGNENLDMALKDSDVVIAIGGVLLTPGIPQKQWMSSNVHFIKTLATHVARMQPLPFFAIVTEPINSLVPMAAEIMRNSGKCDSKKLFGVTTIDAMRAQTLFASEYDFNPLNCVVPVIGGHSDLTAVPLLSQASPNAQLSERDIKNFTSKFQESNDRIIRAKRGWAPTLSIAYSVLMFTRSLLDALEGQPAHVNAYIENNDFGTSYFAGPVLLNSTGVKEMMRFNQVTPFECSLLESSIDYLRRDVICGKRVLEMT